MSNTIKQDKKYRLEESKVFCMAPWVSINNTPNGDVIPCCVAREGAFGNIYKDDIETIWNNEKYRNFRKGILEDKKSKICERCYKEEEWGSKSSYRKHWNELYSNKYDELILKTADDGHLDPMNFYRWDFRFNNLCNLACIGCGPDYSSSWVELDKKMWNTGEEHFKVFSSRVNRDKFLNTIKSQANVVNHIYFAGGEPLLHSEHYEILDELDRLNKIDKVQFMYSTNLTNLNFKDKTILDYWNKMGECKVLVSVDEVDPNRLYYIRYPSELSLIENNIRTMNKIMSTMKKNWSITPTWSVLNTHRMKDMIDYFRVNDLLPGIFADSASWEVDLHTIILMHPAHLSISNATDEWKEYLRSTLKEFEEWYNDVMIPLKNPYVRPFASDIIKNNMNKFRNALNEQCDHNSLKYLHWYKKLDETRETNFKDTFPELAWHYDRLS